MDTDTSAEQPASQSAGQQDAATSGMQNSGTDSSTEYTATAPKDSQTPDPNNAAGMTMQAAYANYGDSSSGQDYTTAGDAYEYQAYPMSAPDYYVTKPAPTPRIDESLLVTAQLTAEQSPPQSAASSQPPQAGVQSGSVARLESPAVAGSVGAVALAQVQHSAAPRESPRQMPAGQDLEVESGGKEIRQDEPADLSTLAGDGGQQLAPQAVTVLAAMAPLDLDALEQSVQSFLARIDTLGQKWTDPALGKGLGPWLTAGLVAAAAFELALWRANRRSTGGRFAITGWQAPTWTWFPGRADVT